MKFYYSPYRAKQSNLLTWLVILAIFMAGILAETITNI